MGFVLRTPTKKQPGVSFQVIWCQRLSTYSACRSRHSRFPPIFCGCNTWRSCWCLKFGVIRNPIRPCHLQLKNLSVSIYNLIWNTINQIVDLFFFLSELHNVWISVGEIHPFSPESANQVTIEQLKKSPTASHRTLHRFPIHCLVPCRKLKWDISGYI